MIQLTAEEYETMRRDALRYRGTRLIFTTPDMAMETSEAVNNFTQANPVPTIENFDQLTDMLIERAGLTEDDLS